METAEVPWIFLSHSGKQKEFTRRLYKELVGVGHHPFFDQDADALPKGHHFPVRIEDACRGCKMGIVVLSHDYLESRWPMIELELLTFHNPNAIPIYPLFYRLHPTDLSDEIYLSRWQTQWDSMPIDKPNATVEPPSTSHDFRVSSDKSSWLKAVKALRSRNGEILLPNMEDDAYIQRIISNICRVLPPPQLYRLGDQFQGMIRMQKHIEELFQRHGVGGSGKTTLCMSMANLFNKDFPGRSCWLEFPSDQENKKQLVKAIKKVLPIIAGINNEKKLFSLPEAMGHLEEGLKKHKVFLAIDNVWGWNLEEARQIVQEMTYISGSKVMVTSRSKEVLQLLLWPKEVLYVPSITQEEAVEALLYYSHASSFPQVFSREDLRNLAQSCFYEEQCHPLLLKAVGDRLKQVGRHMNDIGKEFISHLRAFHPAHGDEVEENVLKVLETSFLAIPIQLQKFFIDLVTSFPRSSSCFSESLREWLSMLHPEEMQNKLAKLEYHGLLEQKKSGTIYVHDLHKDVAKKHLPRNRDAAWHFLFEGDLSQCQQKNLKYAIGRRGWPVDHITSGMGIGRLKLMNCFPELEILYVYDAHNVHWLSVSGMGFLRFLKIEGCGDLKEIEGWQGAPNLVSIKLNGCFGLQNLAGIGCLHKLQELSMRGCKNLRTFPDANLRRLRTLDLSWCDNLESMGGSESALINLEELWLIDCRRLQRIPDLKSLAQLKVLTAKGCWSLREVTLGVSSLTSLQVCDLGMCKSLEWGPDVRGVTCAVKVEELLLGRSRFQLQLQTRGAIMSAFLHLRVLSLFYKSRDILSLDVSGLVSLEKFYLKGFPLLQYFIIGQGALTKLVELRLFNCTSLQSLPDLKQLTSLQKIYLRGLPLTGLPPDLPASLVELRLESCTSLSSLSLPASLMHLRLTSCPSLRSLDLRLESCTSLGGLPPNLRDVRLEDCISLRSLPSDLPASIRDLRLESCTSLTDVSSSTSLRSLQNLNLSGCSSLRDLPDLSHINTDLCIRGLQSCPADPAWLCAPNWRTGDGYVYRYYPGKTLGLKELAGSVGKLNSHFDKLMGL